MTPHWLWGFPDRHEADGTAPAGLEDHGRKLTALAARFSAHTRT